jgi:hypothetical protein
MLHLKSLVLGSYKMKSFLIIIGLFSVNFCNSQIFKPSMLIGKWRNVDNAITHFYSFINDSTFILRVKMDKSKYDSKDICYYKITNVKNSEFELNFISNNIKNTNPYIIIKCRMINQDAFLSQSKVSKGRKYYLFNRLK